MVDWKALAEPVPVRSGEQVLSVRIVGRGPRLILLHGGPGLDHHMLVPLGLYLAGAFEVWLPDLPGHGRSHHPGTALPDLWRLSERAASWIAALQPPGAVLVGHSLGAWLVRHWLGQGRVRPRAAVLIAPPSGERPHPHGARPSRALAWRRSGRSRERGLRTEILGFCTADAPGEASHDFVEAVTRSLLRHPSEYLELHRQLARVLARPVDRCRPGCPTLVLSGSRDEICPPQAAARLADMTDQASLRLIEGEGHVPFVSGPETLAAELSAFLADHGLIGPAGAET